MFARIHRIIFGFLLLIVLAIAFYQYQTQKANELHNLQIKTEMIAEFIYPFMVQENSFDLHKAMGKLCQKLEPDYAIIIDPSSRIIFSYPRVELINTTLPLAWQTPIISVQFNRTINGSSVIETRHPIFAASASSLDSFGMVIFGVNRNANERLIRQNIIIFSAVSLLIMGCLAVLIFLLGQKLELAFLSFKRQISVIAAGDTIPHIVADSSDPTSWRDLILDINQIFSDFDRTRRSLMEAKQANAIANIASQVAHDIRSPLAALDSMVNRLANLPEQERVFMRSAINRIKDIANNLLQKNREIAATSPSQGEAISTQLLSSLLDPLITEKRMQFRSKIGIEIDGRIDAASYGLFANIQVTEFKRVISNLINNAVEVLGDHGAVTLSLLVGRTNEIEIAIRDNGKGIPPDILAKLGNRGETHGKEGGSGLGLYHARTSVESWGGKLRIESEVGQGTSVILTLPRSQAPRWFVSTLQLTPRSSVVILDDDSSIHQIWQGRMDSMRVTEKQIAVVHVSTPDQFRAWVKENPVAAQGALYLADHELLGYSETGLSLIEEFKLGSRSILVTSRFEERQIMEGCQRLKIRMIPKGMAGFVPFSFVVPLEIFDAILIDDDDLVHMTWTSVAKSAGKSLKAFSHPDQFFAAAHTFAKSSPVYVDANLGQGIKGEVVAEEIHKMGFTRIFLATGYEASVFPVMPWLSGICGKDAPWA